MKLGTMVTLKCGDDIEAKIDNLFSAMESGDHKVFAEIISSEDNWNTVEAKFYFWDLEFMRAFLFDANFSSARKKSLLKLMVKHKFDISDPYIFHITLILILLETLYAFVHFAIAVFIFGVVVVAFDCPAVDTVPCFSPPAVENTAVDDTVDGGFHTGSTAGFLRTARSIEPNVNALYQMACHTDIVVFQKEQTVLHVFTLGKLDQFFDELFAAMRRLQAEYGDRVVLDLVGFFDDDYESEVKEFVKDGIAVFHGFQVEPRPYYAKADCVVLPSYHEGMSNVLLEAAAIGRPVITTRVHGCMEAVDEGKNGLLCALRDTDSLYEAMRRMVNPPAEIRAGMGVAGREKMVREFEKSGVVKRTIQAAVK